MATKKKTTPTTKKTPAKGPAKVTGRDYTRRVGDFLERPLRAHVVVVPAQRERMSEAQLKSALAVPDDDRLLNAVRQVLSEEFAVAALEASSPEQDPRRGTYAGGVIAGVSQVRDRLERLRAG